MDQTHSTNAEGYLVYSLVGLLDSKKLAALSVGVMGSDDGIHVRAYLSAIKRLCIEHKIAWKPHLWMVDDDVKEWHLLMDLFGAHTVVRLCFFHVGRNVINAVTEAMRQLKMRLYLLEHPPVQASGVPTRPPFSGPLALSAGIYITVHLSSHCINDGTFKAYIPLP